MSDAVVAVVSIFFIIGITVGIVVVVALSVLRSPQRGWPGHRLDYGAPDQPPDPDWDEDDSHERPHWPDDTGSDLSGR